MKSSEKWGFGHIIAIHIPPYIWNFLFATGFSLFLCLWEIFLVDDPSSILLVDRSSWDVFHNPNGHSCDM